MASSQQHTSKVYEGELAALRQKIVHMGSLVEQMIGASIAALRTRDSALAMDTMRLDRRINRLECDADELSLRILATRQPVASDLRFITMSLKVVTDLERIGDLGVNICERVLELNEEPARLEIEGLYALADEALGVLREALDALIARDAAHAVEILERDDGIDEHYSSIFRQVLGTMSADPTSVYRATRLQSIAKYLERIADHAMNIAETVVFLVEGKDIRHWNRRQDGGEIKRRPAERLPAALDSDPPAADAGKKP